MIKDALKKMIYQTPLYIWANQYKTGLLRKEVHDLGRKQMADFDWSSHKSSDTIFILGSGYSVMNYSPTEWELIEQHDTFGFNAWVFEDFVPTFYALEPTPTKEIAEWYQKAFDKQKEAYQNTPIFFQYPHYKVGEQNVVDDAFVKFKRNAYFNVPFIPNTTSTGVLQNYINNWVNKVNKNMNDVFHYAGSLSYIISMCIVMGYKEIVLLGIDLNDSRYFYDSENASALSKQFGAFQAKRIQEAEKKQLHATNNTKFTERYGCLPITAYFDAMQKALQNSNVEVFVGRSSSALHPLLREYRF